MRVALIGYGNVGKSFARLLAAKRSTYPFRITGIHTRHGSAYNPKGLPFEPNFGPALGSVGEFLDRTKPEVAIEITTLKPESGEPAISHIRAAISRHIHVITANKGPIAHLYAKLRDEARREQVEFRFESTVMDGAPVFNTVRNNLPGTRILGFTGVLNSTSQLIVSAMKRGLTLEDGIREAQALGVAEADPSYDIDGWDSAAKTAALANVLMDANCTPLQVKRSGLRDVPQDVMEGLRAQGQTLALVSRAVRDEAGIHLQVQPEVLSKTDLLAALHGTSNLLLLHTDLMGTIGTVSIDPGVEQTAYGLFGDLVDIAKSI